MMLKEQYRNFLLQLQKIYEPGEAATIADWAFEKIAAVSRSGILKNPDLHLSDSSIAQLNTALADLKDHRPIQYVLGEAWFYNMKLKVNEHVLIPRPETEELVEQLIKDRKSKLTDPAILDIGTGSGCIPIVIKKHLPAANITSIDVSDKAIRLAKENARTHNAGISFKQMDFLDESKWASLPLFDIIISNPPYIPISQKKKLKKNVSAFEPHLALFVPDESPFIFYEKIAAFGKTNLQHAGKIYLETHEDYSDKVADLFRKDYEMVMIRKDMYGKERMILVTA